MKYPVLQNPAADYDDSQFCSTQSASRQLGISHRTVQLWVENGSLQAWKTVGGHRRITVDSVKRLIAARKNAIASLPMPYDANAPKIVLLVDPDHTLLHLYEREIRSWEMPLLIRKASDGFNALMQIGEQRPDLMIMDVTLPGMDSGRMVRTLRQNPRYASIAIIVITSLEINTLKHMDIPSEIIIFTKPMSLDQLKLEVQCTLNVFDESNIERNKG